MQYEDAFATFARDLLGDSEFRQGMNGFVAAITPAAIANTLAQTVLRMTVPGVPDLYQGRERWDFSLVDPDNRAPVDYALRKEAQTHHLPLVSSPDSWRDGQQKQALVSRLLRMRRTYADIFMHDTYEPLAIRGRRAAHAVAFLRRSGARFAIIAAALRCGAALVGHREIVPSASWWEDTELATPPNDEGSLFDILADIAPAATPKLAAGYFGVLPVAVLISNRGPAYSDRRLDW